MPDGLLSLNGPFDVYLESNQLGQTMAHVIQLPGCIVRAPSPELAAAHLKQAIQQYQEWIVAHSNTCMAQPCDIRICNTDRGPGGAASHSGSRVAFLSIDALPMSKAQFGRYLRLLSFSRADLLEIVSTIPEATLALRPCKASRSLREILQHIAAAEQWYLTRIMTIARFPPQPTPFRRLGVVRNAAYTYLRQHERALAGRVITQSGEQWSLRKVLRRFLEHEREHILEIEARLHQAGISRFPDWMSADMRSRELQLAQLSHF